MSVFGVDFGNLNTTVAITRQGGVDIVSNEVSKRETTTIVSFADNERFIGESGLDRYVRNSQNTIFLLKRFVGMYMDDPNLEVEKKFLTCPIKGDDRGRLMFGVNYCDEVTYFYPEQVLAMLLQKLRGYVNLAGASNSKTAFDSRDCVMTVPCYYSAEQRKLVMQACEIAGMTCLSLVNDTTAAGIDYGIFRGSSLGETEDKGQVVGILDIGYGTTVFAVACFWRGHLKMLARTFDRHLGTRDIDYKLFEYMSEEVKKKYHVDVKGNKRASLRLLQACERVRYLLSGNQVAQLNVENLMDVDVNIPSFSRSTLEELSADLIERFKAVVKRGFEESKIPPEKFHSIEMIGGGSRIPMFKAATEELLGRQPNFTLNASETAARGAAITAAVYSPNLRVREFVVSDLPTYPIKLGYYMDNATSVSQVPFLPDINKVMSVQGTDDHYPKVLEITIRRQGGFKLYAFYDNEHPQVKTYLSRKDFVIGEWDIGTQRKDSNATEVRVRVRLQPNGLITVESAVSVELYEVEEPAPEEEGKKEPANEEGEKPAEKPMVKKQKQRRVELSVTPRLDVIGLSGQEVVEFRKKEVEMNDRDMLITKTRDSKNELESYILDNRPRIADGGILTEYMTKEQQAKFIQLANEYENWLYEDGADAELSVYQEKVKTLRAIGDAATDRRRNFEDVEFELPVFKQEVTKAKDTALGAIGKAEHITEEELREVAAKCDGALSWAEQEISRYREQPKSEAPLLTCATLREKQKEAVEAVRVVVQRPAPPKPKEAAAESKNEKSADEQAPAEVPPEENEEVPPVKDELD